MKKNFSLNLHIDVYENDPNLILPLQLVLKYCKEDLEINGSEVEFSILNNDFITNNSNFFNKTNLLFENKQLPKYDYAILNPPYYKLNISNPQSKSMNEIISGQPNLYTLFIAMSASLIKTNGQLVFITPRSFCSGLYYEKFRKWFLRNLEMTNIHIFESRKENFDNDDVLQENIIVKVEKNNPNNKNNLVDFSVSKNKNFDTIEKFRVLYSDIVFKNNSNVFIRIPTTQKDISILHKVDSWKSSLAQLGLDISTGPVIPFRAKDFLVREVNENSVPLLWMHNIKEMKVNYPEFKKNKPAAVCVSSSSMPILLPIKNYVLVKRFSAKEQKRRLDSAVLISKEFSYKFIGIENHINYIHKLNGELSINEAFGIASILNSKLIDIYFRALNGNTQVNATDIRNLPFPLIEDVKEIGRTSYDFFSKNERIECDNIIRNVLDIKEISAI